MSINYTGPHDPIYGPCQEITDQDLRENRRGKGLRVEPAHEGELAEQTFKKLGKALGWITSAEGSAIGIAIIRAAIEKAIDAYDAELDRIQNGKGQGIIHESRAAHAKELERSRDAWRSVAHDITRKLNASRAAHASDGLLKKADDLMREAWDLYIDKNNVPEEYAKAYSDLLFELDQKTHEPAHASEKFK